MAEGHDVFISYASPNKDVADAVCAALEAAGVKCWIAPRDMVSGNYAETIVHTIRAARVMVLVLSAEANDSAHVLRELERSVSLKKPIVPFRLGDFRLADEMEYYVSKEHWIDAFPGPMAERVTRLVHEVQGRLAGQAGELGRDRTALGRLDRLAQAATQTPPPVAALIAMVIALVFIGASLFIGNGFFDYRLDIGATVIDKEVGFLPALNWSAGMLLLAPAILGFGLSTYRSLPEVLDEMIGRHMVVDHLMRPAERARVLAEWHRPWRVVVIATAILFVITVGYSLWEFNYVIGQHFWRGVYPQIRLNDPYQERDWSVAALLPSDSTTGMSRTANVIFSLAAYLYLVGFVAGFVFSVYAFLLAVASLAYNFAYRSIGLRLVPDLRSTDRAGRFDTRGGLQIFEGLVHNALWVTLLVFLLFFLIHLQNIYLRSPLPTIGAFAFPDVSTLLGAGGSALHKVEVLLGAVSARAGMNNLNSAMAYGFGSVLFLLILLVLAVTLRLAASRSQASFAAYLRDERNPVPEWLASIGREACLERLESLSLWPIRWPRANQILLAVVFASICMVFYKLGLILVMSVMAYLLVRLYVGMTRAPRPR